MRLTTQLYGMAHYEVYCVTCYTHTHSGVGFHGSINDHPVMVSSPELHFLLVCCPYSKLLVYLGMSRS